MTVILHKIKLKKTVSKYINGKFIQFLVQNKCMLEQKRSYSEVRPFVHIRYSKEIVTEKIFIKDIFKIQTSSPNYLEGY